MPTPYNGQQSPLEFYAINGRPEYVGSGRLAITNATKIGSPGYLAYTSYQFKGSSAGGPYKNPAITGNNGDQYGASHTNALADQLTPVNGKGTGDQIDVNNSYNGITARRNYNGGNIFDINGVSFHQGSGRAPQLTYNSGIWGYGPGSTNNGTYGANYLPPDTTKNVGQVVIG